MEEWVCSCLLDRTGARPATKVSIFVGGKEWVKVTVEFIKENDGRLVLLRFFKQEPQLTLGLTNPLAHDIRTFTHVESDLFVAKQNI
jgi:hypothetical protein